MTLFVLVIAPFIGSFLGTAAIRLSAGRPIALGHSQCDHCGHRLSVLELVPIASWCALRGRCRHCGGAIDATHLSAELAALGVAAWAAATVDGSALLPSCVFGWLLLGLALVDWRAFILPDLFTIPLLLTGFLVTWIVQSGAILDHAIAAVLGFFLFASIAFFYRRFRGREGLGLGDAKLLAAIGAWVSWDGLPTVVLWGSGAGLAYALLQSFAGKKLELSTRLPFGSFLAIGAWLVWLYGPLIRG
jgi:leader peptidase (prepilin peptidase) / N-methyltransferase